MKDVTQLTEGWSLRHGEESLEATVPGCVHTDLLTAGVIPDPFLGRNETDVAWVGRRAWTYVRDLGHGSAHRTHRPGLRRAGHGRVHHPGGRPVGRTRNMHRRYRFDVTGRTGRLEIRFASAYDEAAAVRAVTGERPNVLSEPSQYIRKMASTSAGTGDRRW